MLTQALSRYQDHDAAKMLMSGGKKKKAAGQKRPRPAAPASSTSPRHHQQQQGTATSSDQQPPQQQQHNKKKKPKKDDKDAGMGLGAWIMLPGMERDIFVDRCHKEIAPLLGVLPAAGEGEEEEEEEDGAKPMDESAGNPSTSRPPDKKKQQKKRLKARVKVFSAKEATAAHKYARKCLCIGINEATRALEKGQLSLLFICRDVKPPRLMEHIAVLAALRGVPFFVLPKATAALGQALGLQRVAALGFRIKEGAAAVAQRGGPDEGGGMENENEEIVMQVQTRLQSFQAFLLAKREYINGEEGYGGGGGRGAEEGGGPS